MEFFALSDKQLYPVTGDCGRKDKLVPAITLVLYYHPDVWVSMEF
ncbi:MAG: hypothetical protein ACLTPG_07375 [Mediterraneibacter gnavus]